MSLRRRKCPRGEISTGIATGLPDESFTVNVALVVFTLSVSRLLNVALKSAVSVNSSGSSRRTAARCVAWRPPSPRA